MIEELDKILAFNNKLVSLKNHPDASRFARGVGAISLIGLSKIFFHIPSLMPLFYAFLLSIT